MLDALGLLGRAMLTVMFIVSGVGKLLEPARVAANMASKNFPQPEMLAYVVGGFEVVAGLLILIGWKTRWTALALFAFTAAATFYFHNFWALEGQARAIQQIMALKNLAVMGAFLMLIANGPGRYSVDGGRASKSRGW